MKIAIGCDKLGVYLKKNIISFLQNKDSVEIFDCGADEGEDIDYPIVAERVAVSIIEGKADRGILICGTGIGMAITANKIPGIRAAQVFDPYSAERARRSNNAQIMTLGSLIIGVESAKCLVNIWLNCEFSGGRSTRKVEKISEIEGKYR